VNDLQIGEGSQSSTAHSVGSSDRLTISIRFDIRSGSGMKMGAGRNEADVGFDAEARQEFGLDLPREFFDKPDGVVEQFIGNFDGNRDAPLGYGDVEGLPGNFCPGEDFGNLVLVEWCFVDAQPAIEPGTGYDYRAGSAAGTFLAGEFAADTGAITEQGKGFAAERGQHQFAILNFGKEVVFVHMEVSGAAFHAQAGIENFTETEVAFHLGE
jgi:hypothetical protein